MGLVFTFHAPKGAFYHSAGAWLPFALPLAVASLPGLCNGAGRWWPFLRRPATHRFLLVAGLVGAAVLSLVGSAVIVGQWNAAHDTAGPGRAASSATREPPVTGCSPTTRPHFMT